MSSHPPFAELVSVMAKLRAPDGCPWDREQDHKSIRFHAVEEVYELIDAIENGHDHDADPLVVTGVYTGLEMDMGFYRRNREINPNSSFSVNG